MAVFLLLFFIFYASFNFRILSLIFDSEFVCWLFSPVGGVAQRAEGG